MVNRSWLFQRKQEKTEEIARLMASKDGGRRLGTASDDASTSNSSTSSSFRNGTQTFFPMNFYILERVIFCNWERTAWFDIFSRIQSIDGRFQSRISASEAKLLRQRRLWLISVERVHRRNFRKCIFFGSLNFSLEIVTEQSAGTMKGNYSESWEGN